MAKTEEKKVDKSIEGTMLRLNKEFGQGSIIMGNQKPVDIPRVSTGSLQLDIDLGGGLPLGRIVEVYGPNASGKTSLCNHVIKEAQEKELLAAMIDMEHSWDIKYAKNLGVNMDKVILSQPDWGEMSLQIAEELIEAGVKVVVIDSVSALVPKAVRDGDMGDQFPAIQGRMMSMALMKLSPVVEKNGALLIFTNQLRSKVGVMYGPTEVTSGGMALPFYASVRLDMRRLQVDKENDLNRTKIKVVKSKISVPFNEIEVGLLWNKGFDRTGEVVDLATEMGIIIKSGSWYAYMDQKIAQGRDAARAFLDDNPEVQQEICDKIMDRVKEQ